MHEVMAKHLLSPKNGMNIYRGCSHGCIYCDARSTCYQMNHAFEDIEVKVNAPRLLEEELRRKRKPCMVGTGAMSDPYMHLEEKLGLTRQCLTVIRDCHCGVAIQTKSSRILRDLDLLKEINAASKCVVQITITTMDDALCKLVEPNVCPTSERLRVLEIMQENGIPTVVWMTPILPYINDTVENISGIVEACAARGVYGILSFGIGLTLRDGDRQYYYRKLDEHFPGLKETYIRQYGNAYELTCENGSELQKTFYGLCRKYGIETDEERIFCYMHTYVDKYAGEQLSLF
ncbi:MAG: SPL family radical SAM protein [Roseburia sp.]